MTFVDLESASRQNDFRYGTLPFYKSEKPFKISGAGKTTEPLWGMSMLAAGSMRFRWNESNPNRDSFLSELCARYGQKEVCPIELIHSKTVFVARAADDTFNLRGDGIITQNKNLVPVVTAADCLPLYFYDSKTGAFGAAHSGWKGTGIAARVVEAMANEYGSKPSDILVAIGPHIHDCCYTVDVERAKYFSDNFGSDCVTAFRVQDAEGADKKAFQGQEERGRTSKEESCALSLLRANVNCLLKAGVLEQNIVAAKNCTACGARFGSFRRQAAALDVPQEQKSRLFTTQAAFVIIQENEN